MHSQSVLESPPQFAFMVTLARLVQFTKPSKLLASMLNYHVIMGIHVLYVITTLRPPTDQKSE